MCTDDSCFFKGSAEMSVRTGTVIYWNSLPLTLKVFDEKGKKKEDCFTLVLTVSKSSGETGSLFEL